MEFEKTLNLDITSDSQTCCKKKYRVVKRIVDILLSTIILIVFSPLMFIVAILIRCESKGGAIFKQLRTGKNGKDFYMYKFRSMYIDNDVMNFKEADKLTRVGKVIRKTSIDELPQFFNILKGNMSFIGPRPWIVEYAKYFTNFQKRRLNVLPGITGLAQCNGRNGIGIKEKIKYDVMYVDNMSFKLDFYIILKTIKTVFLRGHAANEKSNIKAEIDELKEQFGSEYKVETKRHSKDQERVKVRG